MGIERIKRPTLQNKSSVKGLIVFLFSILPLIDSLNGYLIRERGTSIGAAYKMLLICILAFLVIRTGKITMSKMLKIGIPALYVALSVGINILMGGEVLNMDYPIKLVFNLVLFSLLLEVCKYGITDGKALYQILNYSSILMIFCMLVPYLLNVGYTIYSSGQGYKAFFYSQNELNACLIILFFFCLYKAIMKMNLAAMIQLAAIFVCVMLLSTKSSMIACAAGGGVFVLEYLRRKDSKYKFAMIILLVAAAAMAGDFAIRQISAMFERQGYLSAIYNSDVLATITSGRSRFVQSAWELLWNNPAFFFQLLFGNGFCSSVLCEMDFIDIFFFLGAVGAAATVSFFIYVFFKSSRNFKKDESIIRPFAFILILGFAFITGHVLFMATSGCYFVLLCCFNLLYVDDSHTEYTHKA